MEIKQIGRYTLPVGSVQAIGKRNTKGWRKLLFWRNPGYDAILNNGRTIHFTEEEKRLYDEVMDWRAVTLEWLGACKGMGLRV